MLKIGDIAGTEAQGGGLISRLIKFGNQDFEEPKTRVSHDAMVAAPATYKRYVSTFSGLETIEINQEWPGETSGYFTRGDRIFFDFMADEVCNGDRPGAVEITPENVWIMSRLVESTSPKVINTRTVGYYLARGNCYIYRIKGLDEAALERVVGFALDRVGQRYGFRHIGLYAVSAALGRLFSYPVYWIAKLLRAKVNFRSPRIYRNDPKAPMVCSQLVAAAYASLPSRICYPVLDEGRVWENPHFPGITRPYFKREYADYPKIEFGGPWGCIAPDDIDDWCLAESQLLDGRAEEIFVGGLKDVHS